MKPQTVAEYITAAPKDVQPNLLAIRKIILQSCPEAEEKLSYGMPYYGYKGRLVYFAAFKRHIGVYLPTPTVSEFKKELQGYVTSTATIQFPLDKKLPLPLIKKLILARKRFNEEKKKST